MYNSGYSQTKMGLAAKSLHRSKDRSCGYYVRIILFFSSLIQSLIIVSLVLFLIYGEPQQTVEEKRIKDLEQSYSRISLENVALRAKEKNLTQMLNITLTAKKLGDKDLLTLRKLANTSTITINTLRQKWSQCEMEKRTSVGAAARMPCPLSGNDRFLEHRLRQAEELQKLLRANFTEQMHINKIELESAQKDRIRYQLDGIELRRDKALLEERIETYEKKCKEDFVHSLEGIPNVTREFLKRVDDLFSKHISFQLSCDKQSIQLESIRANCSSLSMEVENKLQTYLDKVGSQVTMTIGENAKCMTENKRLNEDATWCKHNRTDIVEENKKVLKQVRQTYDKEVERLLLDVTKLNGNKNLLENLLSVKEIEIKMLSDRVKDLNTSLTICKSVPFPPNPLMPSFGQNKFQQGSFGSLGSTGMGPMVPSFGTSMGSTMLGSAGQGTYMRTPGSSGALSALGSVGSGVTGPGSAGSSTGFTGIGSSASGRTGSGGTVPVGAGLGSVGSSATGLTRTGTGVGPASGAVGSNTAGVAPYGAGRTAGSDPLAHLTQHLKELHQYG